MWQLPMNMTFVNIWLSTHLELQVGHDSYYTHTEFCSVKASNTSAEISMLNWDQEIVWCSGWCIFTRPLLQKGSSLQEEILSVCLSVCLSVITFSFFEYSIIWWLRPCKPYFFWKLIMLATSTALFWPSTTEYQPVPPPTDSVFNDLMVKTM